MADFTPWKKLNKKQKALALDKWHERKDAAKTPEERKAERRKEFMAEEVAPGLTRRELRQDTRTAAKLKYGEAGRQLAQQPSRINSWFGQYQDALKNAQAQSQQNYADAVAGVQNLQSGLDSAAAQAWAGQQADMSADAANRGATVDPTLADVAHNASNVRNVLTGSTGAMLLGQGAADRAYLGKRKVNAGLGRVAALRENAQARQDLAKEKGAFKVGYRTEAKSEAAKAYLNQVAAESLIGDRVADNKRADDTLETTVEDRKADNKRDRRKWANTPTKWGPTNGEWASMTMEERKPYIDAFKADGGGNNSDKDQFGNTTLQQKTRTSDFRKIRKDAKDTYDYLVGKGKIAPGVTLPKAQIQMIYQAIAADYSSANIDILRGAIQKAVTGKIGPKVAKELRELGVSF